MIIMNMKKIFSLILSIFTFGVSFALPGDEYEREPWIDHKDLFKLAKEDYEKSLKSDMPQLDGHICYILPKDSKDERFVAVYDMQYLSESRFFEYIVKALKSVIRYMKSLDIETSKLDMHFVSNYLYEFKDRSDVNCCGYKDGDVFDLSSLCKNHRYLYDVDSFGIDLLKFFVGFRVFTPFVMPWALLHSVLLIAHGKFDYKLHVEKIGKFELAYNKIFPSSGFERFVEHVSYNITVCLFQLLDAILNRPQMIENSNLMVVAVDDREFFQENKYGGLWFKKINCLPHVGSEFEKISSNVNAIRNLFKSNKQLLEDLAKHFFQS